MKDEKNTRLRLTHCGKTYTIAVDSTRYTDELIVNKLKIGAARYWLILQNGTWRFIGDMPLYKEIKVRLVQKVAAWHQAPAGSEVAIATAQESTRTGILLNALLHVMAAKKQMSGTGIINKVILIGEISHTPRWRRTDGSAVLCFKVNHAARRT